MSRNIKRMCLVFFMLASGLIFAAESEPAGISLWVTISSGGLIGILIMIISLVAMAFIIEHFISVTRNKLVPDDFVEELSDHLDKQDYDQARNAINENGSFLAMVIGAGLRHIDSAFGFYDMQNAMQEVSEREISRMYRKLEYLSFIAAVSPILGLLGTVTGMIRAFNQIALTEGTAKPSQLAGGISEALVTTCMGLLVAIPAMFFVTYFRNRIDGFIAEAEVAVDRLMGRFRKPLK